ncbi:MAG: cysteine desulfurase [Bacteroidia bacterium]|nr:cysteine desulfurase [Bacteroidia bacterium]MCX7652882.1 cysteine desulfurase [Bacteroidia bacterium]MDW8416650.1 cysteine desulfurase family protein [Bacteroidia bacterium]
MPERIYLDYAASTPLDPEVEAYMLPYLRAVGNPSSIHAAGRHLRAAIEDARQTVAECIGADPGQIIFTSGGTEADNHALRGAVETWNIQHILYNPTEHHAVLHTIESLVRNRGVEAHPIAIDPQGRIKLDHLEELLRRYPRSMVAVMYANNEIGTLQPINEVAELVQKYEGYFLCDTVQVMGLGWVSVKNWHVDFLAASAHKFYGPKGVGFLYRRRPVKSLITGGSQEREQRAGTENVAGIVGMAYALKKAYETRSAYQAHLRSIKAHLIHRLQESFPEVIFHGDTTEAGSHPGILNFHLPASLISDMILIQLDIEGICASGTSACSSGSAHPSHVLQAIGVSPEEATRSLRFSWGHGIDKSHIDQAVEAIKKYIVSPSL